MSTITTRSPLKVGAILLGDLGVQLLDVAPIDLLACLQRDYVAGFGLPEPMVQMALDIEHYFVSETGDSPHPCTGGFKIAVTVFDRPLVSQNTKRVSLTFSSKHSIKTCPPLDIVLVPGPEPTYIPSPAVQAFLQQQCEHASTFMTVCSGIIPAAHSGVFDGKTATGPAGLLPMLKERFPGVKWVEQRWMRDGKMWSSGGVTNGLDCMAAFMRESWPKEIVEVMLKVVDVGDRKQVYREGV